MAPPPHTHRGRSPTRPAGPRRNACPPASPPPPASRPVLVTSLFTPLIPSPHHVSSSRPLITSRIHHVSSSRLLITSSTHHVPSSRLLITSPHHVPYSSRPPASHVPYSSRPWSSPSASGFPRRAPSARARPGPSPDHGRLSDSDLTRMAWRPHKLGRAAPTGAAPSLHAPPVTRTWRRPAAGPWAAARPYVPATTA